MIDVKAAVQKAAAFVLDLYQDQTAQDLELEEVERSEDGRFWYITLSFLRRPAVMSMPEVASTLMRKREYRIFTVSAETGEVSSMKIRKVG